MGTFKLQVSYSGLHSKNSGGDAYSQSCHKLSDQSIENADGMTASIFDQILRGRMKNKVAIVVAKKRLADGNKILLPLCKDICARPEKSHYCPSNANLHYVSLG